MKWNGAWLASPSDYVAAMSRLQSVEEAAAFRQAYDDAGHPELERNLGYLTGYMARPEGQRVRELLDVVHPIVGDLGDVTDVELLELGIQFANAQAEGLDFDAAAEAARNTVRALRSVRGAT